MQTKKVLRLLLPTLLLDGVSFTVNANFWDGRNEDKDEQLRDRQMKEAMLNDATQGYGVDIVSKLSCVSMNGLFSPSVVFEENSTYRFHSNKVISDSS